MRRQENDAVLTLGNDGKKNTENEHRPDERMNISSEQFSREYMTISEAHKKSKHYMIEQSKVMLSSRRLVWKWQYGFLIFAMIMMYPTPLMNKLT
jgi:hypothetical protein